MEDLTLDVCVLMSGSGKGGEEYKEMCCELMLKMKNSEEYILAMDERGKIEHQYLKNCKSGTLGHQFVRLMAEMNKVSYVRWVQLNRGIRIKLEVRGFTRDSEDYKYAVVASSTECKKLVSHEAHFFNVQGILREAEISVLTPDVA